MRQKWTEDDRRRLVVIAQDIEEKLPQLPALDRYAIVANRIAREDFRPTAEAVSSMLSTIRRARKSGSNGKGELPEDFTLIEAVDEHADTIIGLLTESKDFISEVPLIRKAVETGNDRLEHAITTICDRMDDLYGAIKEQNQIFGKLVHTQQEVAQALLELSRTSNKQETSLALLVEQMEQLLTGLRETEVTDG